MLGDVKGALEEMRAMWLLTGQEACWRNVAHVNGTHSYPRDLSFSWGGASKLQQLQNDLQGLLKHRLLDPAPRVSDLVDP